MKFRFLLRTMLLLVTLIGFLITLQTYNFILPAIGLVLLSMWVGYDVHDIWG